MTVLVATDLSTRSVAALRFAEELAQRLDTALTIIHVAPDTRPGIATDAEHALKMFLREVLKSPQSHATQLVVGETVPMLASAANDCAILVCGATGSSYLDDIFLGSTASRVIRESPSPVCVVPAGHVPRFDAIAVPVGFDAASRTALDLAASIARSTGATLCLFTAVEDLRDDGGERKASARVRLKELRDAAELSDLEVSIEVWVGEPAEGVRAAVAKLGLDMIVMGTHGRGERSAYFLGSVAERLVRQPPCPIVTTRPPGLD